MSSNFVGNKEVLEEFRNRLESSALPEYKSSDIGRDSIVNYCINCGISISTEKYPSASVVPNYQDYMDSLVSDNKASEDYEEFHNYKFIEAFSKALKTLGYDSIKVYYECFESEPWARCYEAKLSVLSEFLIKSEVPIYFLDDTLLFSPDFKYGLCIFHHELLEFYSFGGSSKEVYQLTLGNICA